MIDNQIYDLIACRFWFFCLVQMLDIVGLQLQAYEGGQLHKLAFAVAAASSSSISIRGYDVMLGNCVEPCDAEGSSHSETNRHQ